MSNDSGASPLFRFLKVEEYFEGYRDWETLAGVHEVTFDRARKRLHLHLNLRNGEFCTAEIQFLTEDNLRFRFDPRKHDEALEIHNTRTIVMKTMDALRGALEDESPFTVEEVANTPSGTTELVTRDSTQAPALRVRVEADPFRITIFSLTHGPEIQVWQTATPAFFFTPNGGQDYRIILAVNKPPTARYIGFGEQGGKALLKNTAQVNYFNFDNMRYRQVYNRGPLDGREPLYHSDPFFMEFNGNPATDCVYGFFTDNSSQILVDVGYLNTSRYLIGTVFGPLDTYLIIGHTAVDVLKDFTAIVGRPRLKPRWALGYHQGCYGYENRGDLEWAVDQYRNYQIPLDGLHVDVDIQKNYQTFTIDESKFPNPKEMFASLRARGVKCSTNLTPVISNRDPNYTTYTEGLEKGYFVLDRRSFPDDPMARKGQDYQGGWEVFLDSDDREHNFNSGKPFIGEVYYGGDRGTTGHYADLGRQEVRDWWGRQYQFLFDQGLEMVWQDMTTPAIRNTRGDMRGFPFRLLVTDDFLTDVPPKLNEALKVWNLYSYNLHKATYFGLNRLKGRQNKRNFIVGRGSFTGSHRFAALWTGDNSSSWDFLRINVAQVLSLGMCGLAICGEDIGGFEREEDWQHWADPELLIRWMVAGAFLPWYRNHYIRKGAKYFQEPFMYQTVDLNSINPPESRYLYNLVLPISKFYVERRYRLMQLFYDALFENTISGLPICRPMFLDVPEDKAVYNDKYLRLNDQFFVGPDMLLAPVLEPQSYLNGNGKRDIYLPAGFDWYCFTDNRLPIGPAVEGGTTVRDFDASLGIEADHIGFILPTYVRAGAIIPTLDVEQFVGERNSKGLPLPITLNVYPGKQGSYTMYLDDGVSRTSAPKKTAVRGGDEMAGDEYRETLITHKYTDAKTRQVRIERKHDGYTPPLEKYFFVAILHDPTEARGHDGPLAKVSVAGASIGPVQGGTPEHRAESVNNSTSNLWYYNERINISFIKVFDRSADIAIELTYV